MTSASPGLNVPKVLVPMQAIVDCYNFKPRSNLLAYFAWASCQLAIPSCALYLMMTIKGRSAERLTRIESRLTVSSVTLRHSFCFARVLQRLVTVPCVLSDIDARPLKAFPLSASLFATCSMRRRATQTRLFCALEKRTSVLMSSTDVRRMTGK